MKRLIKDYYNNHYKNVNMDFDIYNYRKIILKEHGDLLKNKNKKILDVGCGTGFLLRVLELEGFRNLTGVEIDINQSNEAKKNLKYSKILNEEIFNFFNKDKGKYDIVFLYDLIEHLKKEKIIPLLKLIYNALNKAGIIIIKTPNADSPFFASRMRYNDFTHEVSFNENSIKMVLREANFKKIICKPTKFIYNSLLSLISLIIRSIGNFFLRIYLATYLGKSSLEIILTPNFIITAKNER